jgi:hypothetical protein
MRRRRGNEPRLRGRKLHKQAARLGVAGEGQERRAASGSAVGGHRVEVSERDWRVALCVFSMGSDRWMDGA